MAQFAKSRFVPTPPEKGSFPLDHDGVCKDLMKKYMTCLITNKQDNTKCREEIKSYLDCRMKNNLMAREDWKMLGLDDVSTNAEVVQNVATIKIKELVDKILEHDMEVKVVTSEHAQHFFSVEELQKSVEVFRDEDEWTMWSKRGDPVLHIELGKWADVLLIAPLDANTLAKISQGLCDNLLTCVFRAWDIKKPLLFCPAMNTRMWEHPVTAIQISSLKSWGYIEVPCIAKTLICGDTGLGAMAEIDTIVNTLIGTIENIVT